MAVFLLCFSFALQTMVVRMQQNRQKHGYHKQHNSQHGVLIPLPDK